MTAFGQVGLPVSFEFDGDLEAEVDRLLLQAEERFLGATKENVLELLNTATLELDVATAVLANLDAVLDDERIRDAYAAVNGKAAAFFQRLVLSPVVFSALNGVSITSQEGARQHQRAIEERRRCGVGLPPEARARLEAIEMELAERTLSFEQNVADARETSAIEVASIERLRGLPERVIATQARTEHGGWRFSLDAATYLDVMTNAEDRSLREQMHRAWVSLATAANGPPLIEEILALRKERAKLLGFATYADYAIDERMLRGADAAIAFVERLANDIRPAWQRENEALETFAGSSDALAAWDVHYWAERQRRALFDFDVETLRAWLPLDHVLERGVFAVAEQLWGLRFERVASVPTWHEDVSTWNVFDSRRGNDLGLLYLDLFARAGKQDGAWTSPLIDRVPGLPGCERGAAMIVTSFSSKLLLPSDVEMLFHELGHFVHHMLSEVRARSLSGLRVEPDLVELPSNLLATYFWHPDVLDRVARHHRTGEPLPSTLKQQLIASRNYRKANELMRQLGFALVDLELHHHGRMESAPKIFERFSPVPLVEEACELAAFTHIFGAPHGYAAGYYAYLWAEMLAADLFDHMERGGGAFTREAGEHVRRFLLSRGDAVDANQLCRDLVGGREPKTNALLEQLGMLSR